MDGSAVSDAIEDAKRNGVDDRVIFVEGKAEEKLLGSIQGIMADYNHGNAKKIVAIVTLPKNGIGTSFSLIYCTIIILIFVYVFRIGKDVSNSPRL